MIDTYDEKFQNSPGLKHWADIGTLKIVAKNYIESVFLSEPEHNIAVKTESGKSAKQSVVKLEHRIKDLGEIIKYAKQTALTISAIKKQKNNLTATYKNYKREVKSLTRKPENLKQYLGHEISQKNIQKHPEQDKKPAL